MRRIESNELRLGEAVPFDVYDAEGNLLLRRGYKVQLASSLERLLREGIYRADRPDAVAHETPAAEEEARPLELVCDTRNRLGRMFRRLVAAGRVSAFPELVRDMACALRDAVQGDRSAALAGAYLDVKSPYALVHHLQAAILAEILGDAAGLSWDEREPLLCAALTHDVALLAEQDRLERSAELSPALREAIRRHPESGAARCAEWGVESETWLETVLKHHERLDGSGYPRGLPAAELAEQARIMAVADCYSAMIRARPYRKALCGKDALRELYLMKDKLSSQLTQLLVRDLGVFPAGSLVRLANGEVGVVVRYANGKPQPEVCAFINQSGMPTSEPQKRDISHSHHAIAGLEPIEKYRQHIEGLSRLWLRP